MLHGKQTNVPHAQISLEDSTGGRLTARLEGAELAANARETLQSRGQLQSQSGGGAGSVGAVVGCWADVASDRRFGGIPRGDVNNWSQQDSVVSNSLADTALPPHPTISAQSSAQGAAPRSLQGESCSLDGLALHSRDPRHVVALVRPSQRAWIAHSMVARDLRYVSSALSGAARPAADPFLRSPVLWEAPLDRRFHHGRAFVPQVRLPALGLDLALAGGSEGILYLVCLATGRIQRVVAMPPGDRAPIRDLAVQGATLVSAQGSVGGVWRFQLRATAAQGPEGGGGGCGAAAGGAAEPGGGGGEGEGGPGGAPPILERAVL